MKWSMSLLRVLVCHLMSAFRRQRQADFCSVQGQPGLRSNQNIGQPELHSEILFPEMDGWRDRHMAGAIDDPVETAPGLVVWSVQERLGGDSILL